MPGRPEKKNSVKVAWFTFSVLLLSMVLFIAPLSAASNTVTFMAPSTIFQPELQEAFALFEQRTGLTVEPLQVASWVELNDKIVTMSAAGVPPDVVYGDDLRIFAFAEQNLLQPIESYIARDNLNLNAYPRPVVEGIRVRGNIYSLPTAVSIYGVFYNTDIFAKYGQHDLPTDWSTEEFRWEDFVAIGKKMTQDTNGDGQIDLYGTHSFGSYGGFNQIGLWNAQDCDFDRTRYLGTDPKVINALNQIMSIYTEHKFQGGNFLTSTAAMQVLQSYYVNNLRTQMLAGNVINWKVGVMPKAEARVSQGAFLSIGIPKGSSNKDNAWRLVRFLAYDTEGAILFTRAENRTPLLMETMRDYLERWNVMMPGSNVKVFADATQVIWRWNLMSGYGGTEIGNILNTTWSKIRNGQVSVQQAIQEIAPQIQAILDDAQAFRSN